MTTLSVHDLKLTPSQLRALHAKAKHNNQTPSEYVRRLIQRDLLASKSFDEILMPVRDGFRKSGISGDEFERLVTRARKAIHAKKKRGRR